VSFLDRVHPCGSSAAGARPPQDCLLARAGAVRSAC
jgi:hypothetical protein